VARPSTIRTIFHYSNPTTTSGIGLRHEGDVFATHPKDVGQLDSTLRGLLTSILMCLCELQSSIQSALSQNIAPSRRAATEALTTTVLMLVLIFVLQCASNFPSSSITDLKCSFYALYAVIVSQARDLVRLAWRNIGIIVIVGMVLACIGADNAT
jgi:hypothetical protein